MDITFRQGNLVHPGTGTRFMIFLPVLRRMRSPVVTLAANALREPVCCRASQPSVLAPHARHQRVQKRFSSETAARNS